MSTLVYTELSREFAMAIANDRSFDEITRDSFAQLAPRGGLSPKLVLTRLDGLAEKIVPAARTLAERLAVNWPSTVYSKIIAVIEGQAARVGV